VNWSVQIHHQQQRIALLLFFLLAFAFPAAAQAPFREEIRIPMPAAGERGLQALFIRPNVSGRYPLVVLSHGAPRDADYRRKMSPYGLLPVAMEFVRRGYAVVIVMRRGYGTSGGNYLEGVACERDGNFTASGLTAAADIRAALDFVSKREDVDPNVMIAAGESAGGFSSIALSSNAPRGLVAVISFAGGRGSTGPHQICQQDKLVQAFANYGKTSRIPTLWIYAENDSFFGPKVAQQFFNAFRSTGGIAEFIAHPSHGEDGHNFIYRGIDLWSAYVDDFLRKHKLPRSDVLIEIPVANLPPPPKLSESGLRSFQDFLRAGPNKAFAVASDGAYGWQAGLATREDATERALERCRKHARDCELYVVNDEVVRGKPQPQPQSQSQSRQNTRALPPPPNLSESGLRDFENFLRARQHKAFAVTPEGAYGWRTGVGSREEAMKDALAICEKYGSGCRLYLVNDELVSRTTPGPTPAAPGSSR
jgi:dienelactone hydrolase